MKFGLRTAAVALCLFFSADAVHAQSSAEDSLRMMAHWRCAAWAGIAKDEPAGEMHFEKGMSFGRSFVNAARSGAISESDWRSTIPVGVALTMAGQSIDFVLGRLFEFISEDAFDQVAKRDASGQALNPKDYILDNRVQAIVAANLMRSSNCAVI